MITRYIIPALGILGIVAGIIFSFTKGSPHSPTPNQIAIPPAAPFDNTVSGTGIVEANTRNIDVGTYLPGIVMKMRVVEGQTVEKGAPLFTLDDRAAQAEVDVRRKQVRVAEASLKDAEVALNDQKDQLKRVEGLTAGASVTVDKLQRTRFSSRRAEVQITLAEAELEAARAALHASEVTLERMTVHAPVSGKVLKVRTEEGEYVSASDNSIAPVLMGADDPLHIRVSIDENDLWRLKADAPAYAVLRSNSAIKFPLKFVRVEPYVLPKSNLSGDTRERVDTRVLEVIYEFNAGTDPIYIGQQLDVFIEGEKQPELKQDE